VGCLVSAVFGDIVLAAGGTYSAKPRPVLIFQNDTWPTGESTIVVPFTSQENVGAHYRIAVTPTAENGLDKACWLEVDKLGAIRTSWLGPSVGRLEGEPLRACVALAHQLLAPAG